jgi:hypothetical protein
MADCLPRFTGCFPAEQMVGSLAHIIFCLSIPDRERGLFGAVRLFAKRGEPYTAEDAARLRKYLRPLGTILDVCRRLEHVKQVNAYA